MNAVLMTNAQLRKTLASVRSLGSKGVPTYVSEITRFNLSAYSRYCSGSFLSPDPDKDPRIYAEWLAGTIASKHIRVLFPMDDNVMDAVIEHLTLFNHDSIRLLPPRESYKAAADKGEAVGFAFKAGAPIPETFYPNHLDEIEVLGKKFDGPIVIKPRHSSGSRGIRIVGRDELLQQYQEVHKQFPFPLLQEFIPAGVRYDVCLLYDEEGDLKASFVQKELRHFPLDRGPSTMQESVYRPDLIELALSIMKYFPWKGIVEIEFMVDPRDGIPKFMEINPRFWNSLHASILSGVDFPWLLYKLACGDRVENVFKYLEGVRCRSLLPGDTLHYLANSRRFSIDPGFWSSTDIGGADDILSWLDPMPTLGFMLSCLRYIVSPKAWKMIFDRS